MNKITHQNKIFRRSQVLFVVMMFMSLSGFVCQWIYKNSPKRAINITDVQHTIRELERSADTKMNDIEGILKNDRVDSLMWIPFEKLLVTFLVFEDNQLIFWSDNQIEPENLKNKIWQLDVLSNVYALTKSKQVGRFNIVAYIPIKNNYPYENKELQNEFISYLRLDKDISITSNMPADKFAVFGNDNEYLFTLQLPDHPIYNEDWSLVAIIFFIISYAILFFLFARFPQLLRRTSISWNEYIIAVLVSIIGVFAILHFNFPVTFFQNAIFTPYHYASSSILSTLTHLSFLTVYLFSLIYLFCYFVKKGVKADNVFLLKQAVLLLLPGIFFVLIFNFFVGVIFNSSTEINILKFGDITFVSVWNHLLFLVWGVSFMLLHVKTHRILLINSEMKHVMKVDLLVTILVSVFSYFYFGKHGYIAVISYFLLTAVLYLPQVTKTFKRSNWFLVVWLFSFTLFVTWASIFMNSEKKFDKYRILAQNYYSSEDTEEDLIANSLLSDLNKDIQNDKRILYLVQFPDSIAKANEYINNAYLRGFWNKYEMLLFGATPDSEWDQAYSEEITNWGRRIKTTNFYSVNNPKSDLAFLGAFRNISSNGKTVNFYMEFYPKRSYKSYSFPNLLIENQPSIQSQLSLSSAKYTFRELSSVSGKFNYRTDARWIEKNKERYFMQKYNGFNHYIYVPDVYNYYILSEEDEGGFWVYILYFFYAFVIYLCISFITVWIFRISNSKMQIIYKFSSKYLTAFIVLLVLSFVSIFYVSLNYMQRKYEDEQKDNLESTKNYIQMALQEKYYWQESLDSTMTAALNFDLQDMSYIYQTDIHVYDNDGKLIGSSQPTLFSRELISRRISPIVYFSRTENSNQYERIGELEYLTAYTDFYNGDFLQIGYIAVPQFLSGDLLQSDLESFLTVIVHIYLIIIVLFIILSLIINRQLSSPLAMMMESLKQIRIGQENKKINYKPRDEIGVLVEQYNKTVDELEKSALMLAKSERESAWKSMARQVAHEINNPLTPMKLTIQHLQHIKKVDEKRFEEYFEKSSDMLIEQIENLSKIAGTFSSFAKLPEANFKRVDVAKKLKSVFVLFSNNSNNVKVKYEGESEGIFVFADREQLILVFNNLLKNALQAIPSTREGEIEIRIESTEKQVRIFIKDNGKGISDDVKEKLFTPNFTTKSTGMGLGLSISRNIIRMAGGDITFETTQNVGTEFKVILPRIS